MEPDFWINDPKTLFANGNYMKVVPNENMTQNEILNVLTRILIYLLIIMILLNVSSSKSHWIPILLIIIIIVYYFLTKKNVHENFTNQEELDDIILTDTLESEPPLCTEPTKNNPFMNVTMGDWIDNTDRPPACIITPAIEKRIDDYFNNVYLPDPQDIYNRRFAQRQFYTMPSTTIPNDQTAFALWLYGTAPSCKENSLFCMQGNEIDLRYSQLNPYTDNLNELDGLYSSYSS